MGLIARKAKAVGGGGLLRRKAVTETAETIGADVEAIRKAAESVGIATTGVTAEDRALADAASARYAAQEDFDCLAVFYFVTHEQRDAFVEALKLAREGDNGQFVNGVSAAKKMAIELPRSPNLTDPPPKERWANLARRPA